MKVYLTGITGGIGSGKSGVAHAVMSSLIALCTMPFRRSSIRVSANTIAASRLRSMLLHVSMHSSDIRVLISSLIASLESIIAFARLSQSYTCCPNAVSAILYESGIDRMVDEVWEVMAPEELRIERVVKRNDIAPEEVRKRIDSQRRAEDYTKHPNTKIVVNDDVQPLLKQILHLLSE